MSKEVLLALYTLPLRQDDERQDDGSGLGYLVPRLRRLDQRYSQFMRAMVSSEMS